MRTGHARSISVGPASPSTGSENGIFATSGWCTHEGAPLSDGYFDAMSATIECPLHQARFHVPTGIVLSAPASEPLRIYPVRVRAGEVYVELRDNEQS